MAFHEVSFPTSGCLLLALLAWGGDFFIGSGADRLFRTVQQRELAGSVVRCRSFVLNYAV